MKQLLRLKRLASGLTLSLAIVASSAASAMAAPATIPQGHQPAATGPQAHQPLDPEKSTGKEAKPSAKLGETNTLTVDKDGKLLDAVPFAGNVSGVDFQAPQNYCYHNRVYFPVVNTTGATKYGHVYFYNQGVQRDVYVTIPTGTSYVTFDGVDGAYSGYLYVWNGTSYVYDEYKTGTNTCNVSVTRTYNTGGWVQLKIQNLGTAYATQVSSELAPNPAYGTYTGTQYDAPAPGGAAIYRWFQVGTSPYAITSYTYGSWNLPYTFTGDL